MTVISVKADISGALNKLAFLSKEVGEVATAKALTFTAVDVRTALIAEMDKAFASPTPFTKNAIYIKTATPSSLTAYVQVKDRQRHYLMFEVMGGERNNTGFENLLKGAGILPNGWYAIPASGAPLNSYGNVQGGLFNKMLSQLQASRDPLTNEPGAGVWGARAKRNRKPLGRYFAVKDGDTTHLRPGIYERTSLSKYAAIRPIFTFTPKRPKYRARFDFYGKGEALARQIFPVKFDAAVRRAIASAR